MGKRIFDGVVTHPEVCPKGLRCAPLSRVSSDGFESYMCCGTPDAPTRNVPTDCYRLCIYSDHRTGVDLLVNLDARDVVDTIAVLSGALSSDMQLAADHGIGYTPEEPSEGTESEG